MQHGQLLAFAPDQDQAGAQAVVQQFAVGEGGELIMQGDVLKPCFILFSFNRGGYRLGSELPQRLVIFGVAHATGMALHDQRADNNHSTPQAAHPANSADRVR
jgi:hypothetical protein